MTVTITKGNDVRLITTLTEDEGIKDVSAATNIAAALISRDASVTYCKNLSLSSTDPDANWALGVVVVTFPAADTGTLPEGSVTLEIQTTISALKNSWYSDAIKSRHGVLT